MKYSEMFVIQQAENEKLERGAIGITMVAGDTLEFSNGITVHFKRIMEKKTRVAVIAPKEVHVLRRLYNGPKEKAAK